MTPQLYDEVRDYVRRSSDLVPYEDIILADWPEGDEHLRWVLESDPHDIVDWAAGIRAEEAAYAAIDADREDRLDRINV